MRGYINRHPAGWQREGRARHEPPRFTQPAFQGGSTATRNFQSRHDRCPPRRTSAMKRRRSSGDSKWAWRPVVTLDTPQALAIAEFRHPSKLHHESAIGRQRAVISGRRHPVYPSQSGGLGEATDPLRLCHRNSAPSRSHKPFAKSSPSFRLVRPRGCVCCSGSTTSNSISLM